MQSVQKTQQYLTFYSNLSSTSHSQTANHKLIELQQSQQAWDLAKSFILHHEESQHGYQLLSKKLSKPYTKEMEERIGIVSFVLGLKKMNGILMFCLAKLAIHLGWESLELGNHLSVGNLLGVLKEIPEAAAVISLPPQSNKADNQRTRAGTIFRNYKKFLAEQFSDHAVQVLDCLENFVNNNFKLESEQLVCLLLTRPLNQISTILEGVILGQKYPNLSNELYNYLIKNEETSEINDFFVVFLAFTRSIDLYSLQPQILAGIFRKILSILHSQRQASKSCLLGDSFDLWLQISNQVVKARVNGINTPQMELCKSAFVELWKIVVQGCLLTEMPKFRSQGAGDKLEIVIDDDEEDGLEMEISEGNDRADLLLMDRFRQTGQDFLHLIFSTVSKSQPHKNSCLAAIFQLTTSPNSLQLQLAIFVTSCIVELASQPTILQISTIIKSITANSNAKDPYIWQQLIRLLGRLGHEAVCDGAIFQTSLVVLRESMGIQELAILACENFNEILVTCKDSAEVEAQKPLLQRFLDDIYASIYFKTKNQKLFQGLTKSSILFIYYFRPDLAYFQQYLIALNQKIQSLATTQEKLQIIDNIALSHNYVSLQASQKFTPLLSQFFTAFLPVAIAHIQSCPPSRLPPIFSQLYTIVSTGGGYNTEIWVRGLIQLSKMDNVRQERCLIIALFDKLMDVVQVDGEKFGEAVVGLVREVEPFVTGCLLEAKENQFKLINKCLNFHFQLLTKYVEGLEKYDPDSILKFIIGRLFKGQIKFEIETGRTSLAIIRNIMAKGYRVQQLLQQTLKMYPKIVDLVWKSLQAILYQAYKQGGSQVYKSAFKIVNPAILPPNPLFQSLMDAIANSNSKEFKNLLSSLA